MVTATLERRIAAQTYVFGQSSECVLLRRLLLILAKNRVCARQDRVHALLQRPIDGIIVAVVVQADVVWA